MKKTFILTFVAFMWFLYSIQPTEHVKGGTNNIDVKTMKTELKEFYKDDHEINENKVIYYENSIKNYVRRYISLFLITSNLRDYKVEDLNEEILVDLEISITGNDLLYLQNLSKNSKDSSFLRSFSKLDAIFSKIARQKEKSYAEKSRRFFEHFFSSIDYFSIFNNNSFNRIFSFVTIFIAFWTIRHYFLSKTFFLFIVILINSNIVWEGLLLYWKRIKEYDFKIFVETMQMKNLAHECEGYSLTWFNSLTNLFWKDKCIHYHETLAKTANEEVSLFQCILDMYFFYIVKTPVRLFGSSISDLSEEISKSVPWPLRFLVSIPVGTVLVFIASFFILILCGNRLKLSFFGAAVEIGGVKCLPNNEQIHITYSKRATPFRKLKPWTKNRSFGTASRDCGKLNCKSITESQDQKVSNVESTSEASIKEEINRE